MIQPQRLLFINSSAELGGADTDLLTICRLLDRKRYVATVVLPQIGPLNDAFAKAGAEVRVLPTAPLRRFTSIAAALLYPVEFIRALFSLVMVIRKTRPSLVHVNTSMLPAAGLAAKLTGTMCLWHIREIWQIDGNSVIPRLLRWWIRSTADSILAVSSSTAAIFSDVKEKTTVIHHGVNTERFKPPANRAELRALMGISEEQFAVGFVGRIAPMKGIEFLVSAMSIIAQKMPNAVLLIVGPRLKNHGYAEALDQQASSTSADIRFVPARQDIEQVLAGLDVLVLPTSRPEPFGLVIIEALACGVPVVATDQGGPLEILQGIEAGRLVPPRMPNAIASAVLDIAEQTGPALREKAREMVISRFQEERMIEQLQSLYDRLTPAPFSHHRDLAEQ